jgi:hypothetical protein
MRRHAFLRGAIGRWSGRAGSDAGAAARPRHNAASACRARFAIGRISAGTVARPHLPLFKARNPACAFRAGYQSQQRRRRMRLPARFTNGELCAFLLCVEPDGSGCNFGVESTSIDACFGHHRGGINLTSWKVNLSLDEGCSIPITAQKPRNWNRPRYRHVATRSRRCECKAAKPNRWTKGDVPDCPHKLPFPVIYHSTFCGAQALVST